MFNLKHAAAAAVAGLSFLGAHAPAASAQAQEATVGIEYAGFFIASGVLIDEEWVLTAAHVVDNHNPALFEITLGGSNQCSPEQVLSI